jgi:hypothetical protein
MSNSHLHSRKIIRMKFRSRVDYLFSALIAVILIAYFPILASAFALEPDGYLAFSGEEFVSNMKGRMGFEREPGSTGTLNDFRHDLGLPKENQTLRLEMFARPLEHHMLRIYGTIPESYTGEAILKRQLILRNQTIPVGTNVKSKMNIMHFGLGYDLDLLLGRRLQGGTNADVRFLNYFLRLKALNSGTEHSMTVDEVVPCLGCHVKTLFHPTLIPWPRGFSVGGYGRLTYGINPNYLNLFEFKLGMTGSAVTPFGGAIDMKVGYQVEGWSQSNIVGRDLEFKREGVFVSLAAAF